MACVWGGFRLGRFLVRRLLWRIRTKLLVSSLFIAVVPVVLLTLFFMLAGVLSPAWWPPTCSRPRWSARQRDLEALARAAVSHAPLGEASLAERMKAAEARHPGLSWVAAEGARVVSAQGGLPARAPAWMKQDDFVGIVKLPEDDRLRAVSRRGAALVMLDLPVDERLVADLTTRTGIKLLRSHTTVKSRHSGITIDVKDAEAPGSEPVEASGLLFVAELDQTDWETGEKGSLTRAIAYQPIELIQRLSTGTAVTGALLVRSGRRWAWSSR